MPAYKYRLSRPFGSKRRSAAAVTETVLYRFEGVKGGKDGFDPVAGLIFDSKGALYGTTRLGGPLNCGIVFKLTPLLDVAIGIAVAVLPLPPSPRHACPRAG